MEKSRYHISKWIFLSLSVLINTFIIVHSCLPSDISGKWSSFLSNILENIANMGKGVNPEHIDVTSLTLSYNDSYAYNHISAYEDDNDNHYLPLGTTKLIAAALLPADASDKSIIYEVDNPDIVTLNQQGSGAALTGKSKGVVNVTAYSNDNHEIKDTFSFTVIDLKEPDNFAISTESLDITLNGGDIIPINIIDDDNLCRKTYDQEVFLPRYYDVRELTYTSSDTSIVDVEDVNGIKNVLVGKSIGTTNVTVSNSSGVTHSIPVTVKEEISPSTLPNIDNIIAYGNDMDSARTDNTIGYNMNIDNVIYQSLSPLNVRVFDDGRVIGYRKTNSEDTIYKIRVVSKYDLSLYKDYDVTLTNPPLSDISISISNATAVEGGYSIEQGQQVSLYITTIPGDNYNVSFTVTSSNTEVASITNEGNKVYITLNMEGEADITITCNEFPSISKIIHIISTKRGIINNDNRDGFYAFVRKAAGHFTLFLLSSVVTTLAIYQFLYKKKYWLLSLLSLGGGIALAGLTELIQTFVPGRSGTLIDVATDSLAYLIPVLVITIIYLIKDILNNHKKSHRENKEEKKDD